MLCVMHKVRAVMNQSITRYITKARRSFEVDVSSRVNDTKMLQRCCILATEFKNSKIYQKFALKERHICVITFSATRKREAKHSTHLYQIYT